MCQDCEQMPALHLNGSKFVKIKVSERTPERRDTNMNKTTTETIALTLDLNEFFCMYEYVLEFNPELAADMLSRAGLTEQDFIAWL